MLTQYLDYWHGHGDDHQYRYYRCDSCGRLVTHLKIKQGGCVCNSSRVRPAALSLTEKVRCLVMPWSI